MLDFKGEGLCFGSMSGWFTAEASQITAEAWQITAEARQITAMAKQITAEAKQITAVARQITAEARQITAEPAFIHKLASLGSKSATSLFSPMLVFRKMCRNKDDDPFACLCNTNEI